MIQIQMGRTICVVVQLALTVELASGSSTAISPCEYILCVYGALVATVGHGQQYAHVGCHTQVMFVTMVNGHRQMVMNPTR